MNELTIFCVIGLCLVIAECIARLAEIAREAIREYVGDYRHRRKLRLDIRAWETIAKGYNPITQAEDKGYAIARIVVLRHELEKIGGNL